MAVEVNNKLDKYFESNKELINYLRVLNLYWRLKRFFLNSNKKEFCNHFLVDNRSIIKKHKSEEKTTKEIIRLINNMVFDSDEKEIDVYHDKLLKVVNELEKGINNSNTYVDERLKKYKLYKKDITFIPIINYDVIRKDKIVNRINQKEFKKELLKKL